MLIVACISTRADDFTLGFNVGSGNYTQGWGTIVPTFYTITGDYKINEYVDIIGNYSWSPKLITADTGDYALELWDIAGQCKIVKSEVVNLALMAGYGSFVENYSDSSGGSDYSKYAGFYVGIAPELKVNKIILGGSYKYYISPWSIGSGYDKQSNTRKQVYDVYLALPVYDDKLSLKVGYTFTDMFSTVGFGDLPYQVHNTYAGLSYKF